MKAVIVIDMPNSCFECLAFENERYHGCRVNGKEHWEEKPKWCPLRPLPKMVKVSDDAYVSDYLDFDLGWNACIKAITGETE